MSRRAGPRAWLFLFVRRKLNGHGASPATEKIPKPAPAKAETERRYQGRQITRRQERLKAWSLPRATPRPHIATIMDKAALRHAILAQLQGELATLTTAAHDAHAEATDEENRAEDKYDMRSQSAAYLAAGQAKLATELSDAIGAYQTLALPEFAVGDIIATGALVTLESNGRPTLYFLGPARGGLELAIDGRTVLVVTAASPLGRQFVGRRAGDSIALPVRTGSSVHIITAVS